MQLVNSTIQDVALKEKLGYEAVVGIINRYVATQVDWGQFERLEVVGLDEIALKKGHSDYVVIVTARLKDGQVKVLAVLPNREKETVKTFLARIPTRLQRTIHTVCTDMWKAYINAAKEVLGEAVVERRLRRTLQAQQETLPNQINQPTATPTLRWVFQLLDGIHRVQLFINEQWTTVIEGLTDLRRKILILFGPDVCRLYQIPVT